MRAGGVSQKVMISDRRLGVSALLSKLRVMSFYGRPVEGKGPVKNNNLTIYVSLNTISAKKTPAYRFGQSGNPDFLISPRSQKYLDL